MIWTSDNGAEVMTWPDGGTTPFHGEKNTNWEGGYRVPLVARWPGVIEPGSEINEIIAHEDWLPTLLAAAGAGDVKDALLKGSGGFKVHLDGYNLMPYFQGQTSEWPRHEFTYWTDDGGLAGLRYNRWKVVFMEQRAEGFDVWEEPLVTLRLPKLLRHPRGPVRAGARRGDGLRQVAVRARLPHGPGPGLREDLARELQGLPAAPEAGQLQPGRGHGHPDRQHVAVETVLRTDHEGGGATPPPSSFRGPAAAGPARRARRAWHRLSRTILLGEAPLGRKRRRKATTVATGPAPSPAGTSGSPTTRPASLPHARAVAGLLFLSGFAALVYETLWVKQLGRVVGVEVHAVTIALSAFFAGLALGAGLLGRLADRTTRPVRLYAILEAGVAALGVLATLALARSAGPFVSLREAVGPLAWALPFALVGLPSFLMGGTLPALLRALRPGRAAVAPATGLLYAANTAGAVAGTLATPFVLVPAFGITGTGLFAGAVGLGVAAAALALDRRAAPVAATAVAEAPARSRDARLALALYAVAGGVALGYEVVWSELLVQFLSTRTYAFAVMLGTYLTGLALGSVLFARFARPGQDPWRVFGLLLAAAGASAILIVAVLGAWLPDAQTFAGMWAMRLTGRETVEVVARFAVASLAILLVPTTLLGAAFPAAARLAAGADRVGGDVGLVAALNTAGGIAGTILTGFVLIPGLGLVRSLGALALVGAALGAVAILKGGRGPRGSLPLASAAVLGVALLAALTPADRLARLLADEREGVLVFYEEDVGGTVAVLEQTAVPGQGVPFRRLYVQGVSNSGDALPSLRYMRLQALLPLLVHPGEPRSVLVLGFGTGITAGALLTHPGLETRVVAELLPSVVEAGVHFSGNFDASRDPRLDIRLGDGRHELLRQSQRYDLITLEPPPPSAAGVVNLYSRDFYELCRERLAPGGLMAQWWPLPTQNDEDSRSLVRTFLDVFPHASAWSTELHEVLLVGSLEPLALDGPRVAARFASPEVAAALAEVGVESPEALLATWITGREGLERYAGAAPPVTDDRPLIEHAAWIRRGEIRRVLPRLLDLASDVPLPADDPLGPGVEAERDELFVFYRASLTAMGGDREGAVRALLEGLGPDLANPYYLWVARGGR